MTTLGCMTRSCLKNKQTPPRKIIKKSLFPILQATGHGANVYRKRLTYLRSNARSNRGKSQTPPAWFHSPNVVKLYHALCSWCEEEETKSRAQNCITQEKKEAFSVFQVPLIYWARASVEMAKWGSVQCQPTWARLDGCRPYEAA